jgi:WD40 repeat protein
MRAAPGFIGCYCTRTQIRYLCLHDGQYLRTFKGHSKPVVSLEMSPKEDIFASASLDDTIRIWDLRSTDCQAVMHFASGGERPAVAFDDKGVVLAAAICGQTKVCWALIYTHLHVSSQLTARTCSARG